MCIKESEIVLECKANKIKGMGKNALKYKIYSN